MPNAAKSHGSRLQTNSSSASFGSGLACLTATLLAEEWDRAFGVSCRLSAAHLLKNCPLTTLTQNSDSRIRHNCEAGKS